MLIQLDKPLEEFQIIIEATTQFGHYDYFAIDDVALTYGDQCRSMDNVAITESDMKTENSQIATTMPMITTTSYSDSSDENLPVDFSTVHFQDESLNYTDSTKIISNYHQSTDIDSTKVNILTYPLFDVNLINSTLKYLLPIIHSSVLFVENVLRNKHLHNRQREQNNNQHHNAHYSHPRQNIIFKKIIIQKIKKNTIK